MDLHFGINYKINTLRASISRAKMNVLRLENTLSQKSVILKTNRAYEKVEEPFPKKSIQDITFNPATKKRAQENVEESIAKRRKLDGCDENISVLNLEEINQITDEIHALKKVLRVYQTYIKNKHEELMKLKKMQPYNRQEVSKPHSRSGVLVF